MDQGPLVTEQIEAGANFLAEFEKKFPLSVAFWLKATEEDSRYFYVVSDAVLDEKLRAGYGEVFRIAGEMRDPDFDPLRVKLVGSSDPLARAVLDVLRLYPGGLAKPIRRKDLGATSVEEVYIYPTMNPV
jgi:hypothetical protein